MGLDVYLYKFEDFARTKSNEKRYSALSETLLKQELGRLGKMSADEMTREERNNLYQMSLSTAKNEGIIDTVEERDKAQIEIDSSSYPDHLFKVGYFRSSPNPGGLNNILHDRIGKSLHYIFTGGDIRALPYEFKPDWEESLVRAREVLVEFKTYVDKYGDFGVVRMPLRDPIVTSERDALNSFNQLRTSTLPRSHYLEKPLDVHAVIPADKGVFLIFERKTSFEWYFEAMNIVIETCQWVLARPQAERDKMYLIWAD